MEEPSEQQEQNAELDCDVSETKDENASRTEKKSLPEIDSLERSNQEAESNTNLDKSKLPSVVVEGSSPMKTKETATGTKVKRKARSTRRKLNAMVSNASLHFSDTDSEGELTTINSQSRLPNVTEVPTGPIISVTSDDVGNATAVNESWSLMSPDGTVTSRRNSFVDNLTDVDEIYASETENEPKECQSLKTVDSPCQGETDLEDFEDDDEIQTTIVVEPRSDIFCDYSGETITTKEGDGPFSVEVRNKLYREEVLRKERNPTPEVMVLPITDEEDMAVSDEEDLEEACYSHKDFPEDLEVLAASQIVMKNMNKMENMLNVKDANDDASSDCHTDVEDVDQIEIE